MNIDTLLSRNIQYNIPDKLNKRDKLILEAYKRGASSTILALEFNLSRQRIHQIINKYKKTL